MAQLVAIFSINIYSLKPKRGGKEVTSMHSRILQITFIEISDIIS